MEFSIASSSHLVAEMSGLIIGPLGSAIRHPAAGVAIISLAWKNNLVPKVVRRLQVVPFTIVSIKIREKNVVSNTCCSL